MPPKGKARAKSTSVGAKARAKASPAPSPEPKAKAKAKAGAAPAKDEAVERAETLLRECLAEEEISRVDGRVLEIAVLDGRSKKVDADLLAKGEARYAEWQAFQEELQLKAEELRSEKEAAIARHDEENILFGDACDSRKALVQKIEELFSAVEDSELGSVRAWVEEHVLAAVAGDGDAAFPQPPIPIDCEDHEQNTPLSEAACYGELEIVEYLLSQGAHVNVRNCHGKTPLWRATYNGHEDIVRLLLERGADPTIESAAGEEAGKFGTPATKGLIAEWSQEKTAERQAALPAWQRLPKPWPRLLLDASTSGDVAAASEITQAALEAREDPAAAAPLLRTIVDFENMADALWTACTMGHTEVASVLLEKKADVDSCSVTGKTCLMMACRKGNTAVVKLLLQHGAKTHLRSAEERLASDYSREAGHALHDVIVEHCRRTREWSTLEDEAQRASGLKVCGAEAVEGILDTRRNIAASNRATAELQALGADELREGSNRKDQLLEERALADVLGLS